MNKIEKQYLDAVTTAYAVDYGRALSIEDMRGFTIALAAMRAAYRAIDSKLAGITTREGADTIAQLSYSEAYYAATLAYDSSDSSLGLTTMKAIKAANKSLGVK